MGLRKLSPGAHEYLTNAVACHDRRLEPGELLSDYFLSHGYPAGEWYGAGAQDLGLTGEITPAQMQALFGEGRHPNADAIETEMIADGATAAEALKATRLGRSFPKYSALDHLRGQTARAYKDYNLEHGRPIGAPIDADVRRGLRRAVQEKAYREDTGAKGPLDEKVFATWLAAQERNLKSAVSGYEMVFAPDKSVSVAWAMAAPAERELIANLVRQAARDTLTYVERNLAYTRRGTMGEAQVDVDGITAALFEHWDSRAGDPHFHIHALIAAKVRRSDDKEWTALDGRTILAGGVTASQYFDSRTRDLFREHGARWSQRASEGIDHTRKVWQLADVPLALVKGFSQRTRQFETARARRIVEFRALHGKEPTPKEIFAIDRAAKLDGRPGKQPPKSLAEHSATWRTFAETLVPAALLNTLGRRIFISRRHLDADDEKADLSVLAASTLAVVSEKYAHFSRWNLESEAHAQTAHLTVPAAAREKFVADVVGTILASRDTLALQGVTLVAEPPFARRSNGESVFHEHHSTRYTTVRTLAEEGDLVAWARRRGGHQISERGVRKALRGAKLNTGQQRMVTQFARSGRRLQLALAPAGTGKTAAMAVFAEAWRSSGGRVYAFGPSARAAQELGASIDARPHTLHQLPTAIQLGFAERMFPMQQGDLLIVDEAAMAGTHTLHTAVKYALDHGADVRMIGDDKQLAAVEAGGAIRLIAHDVGAIRFNQVVRFKGHDRTEQAAASLQIRNGNPDGLDYYLSSGRVKDGSIDTMRDAALHAWRADLRNGTESLLIVPTNVDTMALNLEARELRLRRSSKPRGREVELHDGTAASIGDLVVTRHNRRRLTLFGGKDFVKNGDTWRVIKVNQASQLTVQHENHGARITLPPRYVHTYVELAYATTINRVQGMTSKGNAHLLVPPTMTREQFYPGVTRAMWRNFIYVVTHHHVIDLHQETPEPAKPKDVLTGVLKHSEAEVSATQTLRDNLRSEENLGTLVLRYNYTATYRDEDTYRAALQRHAPETLDHNSEAALLQTLRNANDLGWQADTLIPAARGKTPIVKAKDPGAVLHQRITNHLEQHDAPLPAGDPAASDITRWRGIFDAIVPDAPVEDLTWTRVWQRASGALAIGFDTDAIVTRVAQRLAARHHEQPPDPMPDHRWAEAALVYELAMRANRGEAHTRALPWQARPDFAAARAHDGAVPYLHDMNAAIRSRLEYLRAEAIRTLPAWATGLGARPGNPITAEEWDDLVGLAAAYRETFRIREESRDLPIGKQPDSHGARAHAWHDITRRWDALAAGRRPPADKAPAGRADETPSNKESATNDEVLDYLDATDTAEADRLHTLVAQYNALARDGDNERFLDLIARYVPAAVNRGAERFLLFALADAQNAGWQVERLLRAVTRGNDFAWAGDPDVALLAALRNYRASRLAPARTATPAADDVASWRVIIGQHLPDASVGTEDWNVVWRHAAAAALLGIDADAALDRAVRTLATQQNPAEVDGVRVAHLLVRELTRRHRAGEGHHRALPWLAVPDLGASANPHQHAERLDTLNDKIHDRVIELREDTITTRPGWTRALGPVPKKPALAARWTDTIGTAAAYRETYRVHSDDASAPLGPQPPGRGAKAKAWQSITERWTQLAATADEKSTPVADKALRQRVDAELGRGAEAAHLQHTRGLEQRSSSGTESEHHALSEQDHDVERPDDEHQRSGHSY
jgi:conjugative relaxase-like TrwC/TraI family protein